VTAWRKLVLIGSLYVAQGLPYGFFTQALPVLLRERGLALPLIGLSHLLTLPWALKFLWAPLIDRVDAPRLGRRRAVLIPLQLAGCAVFLALALLAAPGALWALAVAALLVNAISATQDIATDALAVELLTTDERGLGNALQVGGYRAGMILGGGLIPLVFALAGWTVAFVGMAGLLLLATAPVLAYREPARPRPAQARPGLVAVLGQALARPGLGPWLAVLATFKTGEWLASGMLRALLTDEGATLVDVSLMLGGAGFGAALVGALVGGALVPRLGRRRALIAFGCLQAAAIAGLAVAAAYPSAPVLYTAVAAEHLTSAMATAALFTAMMDMCRPEHAATDYTLQASLVVIAAGAAAALSGVSAEALGYPGHFALAAVVAALGVAIVATYRPTAAELALLPPRRAGAAPE
jgi:MFS family permease